MAQMKNQLDYERLFLHCPASNVQMHITFHKVISADELECAINKAVKHRATLCSRIRTESDGSAYFEPCPPRPVKVTMLDAKSADFPSAPAKQDNDNIDLNDYVVSMQQLTLDVRNGEWIRSALTVRDGCSIWLLTWNHIAGDGMSVLYFIRDVQESLLHPELEFTCEPLTLCNPAERPGKLPGLLRFGVRMYNKSYTKKGKSFTREDQERLLEKYWTGRTLSCSTATLQSQQLRQILDKTHDRGVTLTSALIAAFMLNDNTVRSAGLAVNVRPEGCEVAANWAGGISADRPKKSLSFWELADDIHNRITRKLQRDDNKYFLLHFFHEMNSDLIDSVFYAAHDGYTNRISRSTAKMFGYMGNPVGSSFTNLMRAPIEATLIRDIAFYPPMIANACKLFGLVTVGDTLKITYQTFAEKEQTEQGLRQVLERLNMECTSKS